MRRDHDRDDQHQQKYQFQLFHFYNTPKVSTTRALNTPSFPVPESKSFKQDSSSKKSTVRKVKVDVRRCLKLNASPRSTASSKELGMVRCHRKGPNRAYFHSLSQNDDNTMTLGGKLSRMDHIRGSHGG
jgi:hypothetical protein